MPANTGEDVFDMPDSSGESQLAFVDVSHVSRLRCAVTVQSWGATNNASNHASWDFVSLDGSSERLTGGDVIL